MIVFLKWHNDIDWRNFQIIAAGSCQNRRNVKTLNAYNSKTSVHKLMKLCTLRDGNILYLMIESSLQLALYKRIINKFKNFKDLFENIVSKISTLPLILIVAHNLVYNFKKIGWDLSWQYIKNWHWLWMKLNKKMN